ncbi:MAG: RNA pyrophosphohydrolase [Rhodobacteraceae bacterium]|nr:RNA pyrophosphohydrolase [Paracoccaceae bacterium]
MKKTLIAVGLGISLGALTSFQLAGPVLAQSENDRKEIYEQLDLFGDIFDRIRAEYVEEVDESALIEAAINGMLTSLDPHSSYLAPKAAEDMRTQTRGEFGGLGIEVTMEEGFVKVVSPIDGTPAFDAGVEAGDFITHVDGDSVLGLTLNQAVERMRGPVGSDIVVTIVREGEQEPFDLELTRDVIELTAARARTEGDTVVVRVTTFNDNTRKNIVDGLNKQVEEAGGLDNINGLVLDLRNNPGGLLSQAIKVADDFLEKGEIVSTRGRNPEEGERYNAKPGDIIDGKPIVVLINGGSASASEIVAGALKDHRRAVIVGTQSFGKGSVQTVMPLRGSAAMRLTTSRYYTPSGRSIQNLGVTPDIVVKQPRRRPVAENEEEGIRFNSEADLRGSLSNDSLSDEEIRQLEEDREKAENAARLRDDDYQLAYAIDILRGIDPGESPKEAALRELEEETGVSRDLVRIEAENEDWLAYDLPLELLDKLWGGKYRGQEQKWFRMRFLGSDAQVNIETDHPEFVEWKWIDQSEMVDAIVPFKRDVYIAVLDQIGTAKP